MPLMIRRNSAAATAKICLMAFMTFALSLQLAEAQTTSLYIPGFEPQPVSADILGVGADGRTTWALHQGRVTHTSDHSGFFIGTATLVEGPNDASLTYANSAAQFTIGQVCSFSDGFAICTLLGGGSTAVQTELTSHVPVQVSTSQPTDTATITRPDTATASFSQPSSTASESTFGGSTTAPTLQVSSQTQSGGPPSSISSSKPSISSYGPFMTILPGLLVHAIILL